MIFNDIFINLLINETRSKRKRNTKKNRGKLNSVSRKELK